MKKIITSSEKFKDLAYSFKDAADQEKKSSQKLLRIIRELEKRISRLEAQNTFYKMDGKK